MASTATLSLATLARRINEAHENCLKGLRHGLQHAIRAGQDLVQAKGQLEHGDWETWIEANCAFPLRTAQWYMQVAQLAVLLGVKAQDAAHLPQEEVLRLLSGKCSTTEQGDPKPPRFEAWMKFQDQIVEWAKAHDKAFAVKWLRRLAGELEENL